MNWLNIFKCVINGMAFIWLANMVLHYLLPPPMSPFADHIRAVPEGHKIALMLYGISIGPILEEIIFRKWVLGSIKWLTGLFSTGVIPNIVASIVSSALFAAAHNTASGFPFLFVAGMTFAWVYLKTKTLVGSTIIHSLNNCIAFLSV